MKKQDIKNGMLIRIKDGRLLYIIRDKMFKGVDVDNVPIVGNNTFNDNLELENNNNDTKYNITEIYSEVNGNVTKGLFSTENRTLLWKKDDKNFKEYLIDTTDYVNEEYKKDYDTFENSIYVCPNYKCNGYKSEKNEEQDLIYIDIAEYRDKANYSKTNNDECTSLTIEKAKELIKALTEIVEYVEGE
jgi:hypothetical protein